MPVYTVACRSVLGEQCYADIANAITDTHVGITGAPPEFVNVLFNQNQPLKGGASIAINGNVRSGGNRNRELTEELREALQKTVANAAKFDAHSVIVELLGFPASWGMEGGEILPEPGDEAAWLDRGSSRSG